MKYKSILKAAVLGFTSALALSACSSKEFEEITEINLSRCLEPQNLSAKIDVETGDYVTFSWNVNKDADTYNLIVYSDEEMTTEALNETIMASEVPYTVRLTADVKYTFKVQAIAEKRQPSVWAVYDGTFKTYAVKDNLFLEITGRTENSVSFAWDSSISDYEEVTHIEARPVKGGSTVKFELGDADKAAAAATVTGLNPSTEYQFTLFYLSASRGALDAWTKADPGSAVEITTSEELQAQLALGGDFYLPLSGSPYSMGTVKSAGTIRLIGEIGADGSKPVVTGKFELTDALEAGASLYCEGIKFDAQGGSSRIVEHTGGTPVVESIEFVNCEITGYTAGLFYGNNDNVVKIGSFTFDSCDIYDILGSGGDSFDIRKSTEITSVKFVNNTIRDGIRTMFRIDASDQIIIGNVDFENNTVKNIATMNDGNNRGFFAIRVPHEMTLKKNLFLWEDGGLTEADKAQLFQNNANTVVPTLTASDNYSYASGPEFFTKVSAAAAGFTELEDDPCYNSKGNFFQLANTDLISAKVGASKWWISYVEKEEDLTQNVLSGAHTWNLQDATLFAGEVKNKRVRDELLLVGTEATPMNADEGINFLSPSVLTKKGVPTEGYISFMVDTPGSVDLLLSDAAKTGGSLVIALSDDNGFAIQGGEVAAQANPSVQKVVIPKVSGEGTVFIYATNPVELKKLAWSLDTKGGNPVLSAPKVTVAPVTLTEGDATEVVASWDAVDNAETYSVIFNKKQYDAQAETTFTVPAEDIAGLKAGLYTFSVTALPSDEDIYYTKSDAGTASFAIQPLGGGGEAVTVTKTWDFSAADWQAEFAKAGAVNTDITNWNLTYDDLTIVSVTKSKYNTTFFQFGGKSVNTEGVTERYFRFTAPEQGTLKIRVSNTGSSEDLSRTVQVDCGGETDAKPGGVPSTAPTVLEFNVKAGEVTITAPINGLRFYSIEYTYTTAGSGGAAPIEFDWDFSAADWQAEFAKAGAVNTDITNWNLTYDGLTIYSVTKSKYNTTFFQFGGKSVNTEGVLERCFRFTAPEQGTVKIRTSNTGSSEALDRTVQVESAGVSDTKPGGVPSTAPTELEFSVAAGEVTITAPVNALRFYRIYYTNQ